MWPGAIVVKRKCLSTYMRALISATKYLLFRSPEQTLSFETNLPQPPHCSLFCSFSFIFSNIFVVRDFTFIWYFLYYHLWLICIINKALCGTTFLFLLILHSWSCCVDLHSHPVLQCLCVHSCQHMKILLFMANDLYSLLPQQHCTLQFEVLTRQHWCFSA